MGSEIVLSVLWLGLHTCCVSTKKPILRKIGKIHIHIQCNKDLFNFYLFPLYGLNPKFILLLLCRAIPWLLLYGVIGIKCLVSLRVLIIILVIGVNRILANFGFTGHTILLKIVILKIRGILEKKCKKRFYTFQKSAIRKIFGELFEKF